jgi:hypothetical protein
MKNILKQDNFILGIIIGTITPWIPFGILYLIIYIISTFYGVFFVTPSTLQLLSIVINVFIMRYYLVTLKFDKTGRGVLFVTFIYIIAYFVNDYLIK